MTANFNPSKENVLSIRINNKLLEELDILVKINHTNRSDFIRKAISDSISFNQIYRFHPTFLVSPEMFGVILSEINEDKIKNIAKLSILNAKLILKTYLQKNIQSSIVEKYLKDKRTIISALLKYIIESILSSKGQNWLKKINYTSISDKFTITGTHSLGENFSKFLYYYFIDFFFIFDFKILDEKCILTESTIKIIFSGENDEFDINVFLK